MSENRIQTSFASGELSPSLFARTDLQKYHSGAALLRNFFVDYRSGASTRAGTRFVIQAKTPSTPVRLFPFQYSTITSFIVEMGQQYARFISNGAAVLETGFAISGVTNTNPATITAGGNNFSPGDWVFITGIFGTTQLNGRFFTVGISGATFSINDVNGNPIDSTLYGAYVSGGTVSRVYTIATPFQASDLALVKYAQNENVMTFTHPSYPPQHLTVSSTNPLNAAFGAITFANTISPPFNTAGSYSGATGTTTNYSYLVTAVSATGEESLPSTAAAFSGAGNIATVAGTNTITWTDPAGATSINVYKTEPSYTGAVPTGQMYGFIGIAAAGVGHFIDTNIQPDFATTPPIFGNPFANGNNPGCTCFFQQRQYYAASTNNPMSFWASQPGSFTNFNITNPIQADNAIKATLASLQVNAIKWMLPMPSGLILGTSKGAWQLTAAQGNFAAAAAVTPINATANPQAYNGSSDLPPIVVNYDIVYVQAKGSIVRDLAYNIYASIYTGSDISILSNHLFFGHNLTQWAYAEEPFKIIWAIRDDGVLLSLTFVKEQEMWGWARHDTLGLFQSVATVVETDANNFTSDAVYFVVQRNIGGQFVQMVERMADRTFAYGAEDAWCVDCGIQSALVFPAATLSVSGTTPAAIPSTVPLGPSGPVLVATGSGTFTASAAVFSPTSVGQILRIGGGIATVTGYISPTSVIGSITQPISQVIPNDPRATPIPATQGNWSLTPQFTVFTGLDYLNGQSVACLADGGVVNGLVVTNGQITLPQPASKVTVGLPFTAQLQTLPLDTGEPTIQGKRKRIAALTVRAASTRGLAAGSTFSSLIPIKEFNPNVALGSAIPLVTGDERIIMDLAWRVDGQICLQQSNPLPATVLGVIPEIVIGDTVK